MQLEVFCPGKKYILSMDPFPKTDPLRALIIASITPSPCCGSYGTFDSSWCKQSQSNLHWKKLSPESKTCRKSNIITQTHTCKLRDKLNKKIIAFKSTKRRKTLQADRKIAQGVILCSISLPGSLASDATKF